MHVCWCTLIANNARLPPSPSPRSQESHQKAENCLKFVSKLQEPCLELSKAEPKAIPALLPRLLHTVRIISLHSDHYRSRERITALLRKVGWLATLGTGTRLPYVVLRCSVGCGVLGLAVPLGGGQQACGVLGLAGYVRFCVHLCGHCMYVCTYVCM